MSFTVIELDFSNPRGRWAIKRQKKIDKGAHLGGKVPVWQIHRIN